MVFLAPVASAEERGPARALLRALGDSGLIWSNARRFCFIHVPKTGGTSVTAAYEPFLLFDDVVLGGTLMGEQLQGAYRARFGLHKHSGAGSIADRIGRARFESVFSFALIREPVDRMVSCYRWLRAMPDSGHPLRGAALALDFEGFAQLARDEFLPQFDHVTIDRAPAVTRLYRFEDLPAAWADVCRRLGIASGPIGHENASDGGAVVVSGAARRRIEALYPEDTALYAAATRL